MVEKLEGVEKIYYQCKECGHIYETEELAQRCENWCKKNRSCNLEIVKYSVKNFLMSGGLQKSAVNNKPFFSLSSLIIGVLIGSILVFGLSMVKIPQNRNQYNNRVLSNNSLIQEIVQKVLPRDGFQINLVLGDTIKKMVDCGVIDLEKIKKIYDNQIPEYLQKLINGYYEPLVINQETANYLLNIFWPLGLSNKTEFNKNILFTEKDLPNLASTGGWWLGKKDNGAEYFNKCEIIKLTPEQEKIVYEVARNTFRPCCDNSTFAQDCNHGSALLGALELAASQGYTKDELYKLALQLNSFWFPQNYVKIALYKKLVENTDWPIYTGSRESSHVISQDRSQEFALIKEIMSAKYSSISGYIQNVEQKLAKLNLPELQSSGGGCGL